MKATRVLVGIFFLQVLLVVPAYSQQWKVFSDSAKAAHSRQSFEPAINYYQKAIKLLEQDSLATPTHQQLRRNLTDLYISTGDNKKAIELLKKTGKIITDSKGMNGEYAGNLDRLGQVYLSMGELVNAATVFLESQTIKEKIFSAKSSEYAASCNALGIVHNRMGEYEKAIEYHTRARDIRATLRGKNDPQYAQSCNNLAAVYQSIGDFEQAELMALEAKRIREKLAPAGFHESYAITCANLGNIYRDIGQYAKAEALYLEAKNIRSKLSPVNEHPDYTATCIILANLYTYMGEYSKAETLYIETKRIRERQEPQGRGYAESCNNLGNLYSLMGRYDQAEALTLEAKKIWDSILGNKDPNLPVTINNMADLYFAMGDYTKAENYYQQARQLWKKNLGDKHPYYFQNSANLGKVYWNMQAPQKTNELYTSAFQSQYNEIDKIFRFTSETEKQQYLQSIQHAGDEYQSFYYQAFDHMDAAQAYTISLLDRNLILSSLQQIRQTIGTQGDRSLKETYSQWVAAKQLLAKMYAKTKPATSSQLKDQEELSASLEKQLARNVSAFKQKQQGNDWKQIRAALTSDEAAIEFISFTLFNGRTWTDSVLYAALVINKQMSQPLLVPLFEESALKGLLKTKSRDGKLNINLRYSSDSLYNLVWKPLEPSLNGITKIYFATTGLLHQLPMSILRMNDRQVLGDKYHLIQLLTTASVLEQQPVYLTSHDKIVLYGDVQYSADSSALQQAATIYAGLQTTGVALPADLTRGGDFQFWQALPSTGKEVDEIAIAAKNKGISTLSFKGIRANEESFKQFSGDTSVAALHIATHGFFYPDPAKDPKYKRSAGGAVFKQSNNPLFRAGLVMAGAENAWQGKMIPGVEDGILTAYEVSTMDLPNTSLVVLSACETGLGDIQGSEGVYGLQRSFKIAGVKYMVMSLWEVPDADTYDFMHLFYQHMFEGKSIELAFQQAQGDMKARFRFEPYRWGAWILVR